MSTDDSNPYQASTTDPKPHLGERESMEYMRAINYVTESPKWTMNLLWGSLCILSTQVIPIVGQLLWIGYQFEIVEDLLRHPGRVGYPDFDKDRFKEYLTRGLWIFLVMLVVMVVFAPVMGVMVLGLMAVVGVLGAASGGDEQAIGIGVFVMMAVMMVLMFVFSIVMTVVVTPLTIRAGLTQDFRASFDFAWIKDFMRQMWIETLLAQLFWMASAVLLYLLGALACLIGVFPAVAFVLLVQGHLYMQLYQLYLSRGGQPIPFKDEAPAKPVTPE